MARRLGQTCPHHQSGRRGPRVVHRTAQRHGRCSLLHCACRGSAGRGAIPLNAGHHVEQKAVGGPESTRGRMWGCDGPATSSALPPPAPAPPALRRLVPVPPALRSAAGPFSSGWLIAEPAAGPGLTRPQRAVCGRLRRPAPGRGGAVHASGPRSAATVGTSPRPPHDPIRQPERPTRSPDAPGLKRLPTTRWWPRPRVGRIGLRRGGIGGGRLPGRASPAARG